MFDWGCCSSRKHIFFFYSDRIPRHHAGLLNLRCFLVWGSWCFVSLLHLLHDTDRSDIFFWVTFKKKPVFVFFTVEKQSTDTWTSSLQNTSSLLQQRLWAACKSVFPCIVSIEKHNKHPSEDRVYFQADDSDRYLSKCCTKLSRCFWRLHWTWNITADSSSHLLTRDPLEKRNKFSPFSSLWGSDQSSSLSAVLSVFEWIKY